MKLLKWFGFIVLVSILSYVGLYLILGVYYLVLLIILKG